jgi:hypothetical protein
VKYKTSELTGALLDAAVAKAEGRLVTPEDDHPLQPGHCRELMAEWGCHIVRWYGQDGEEGGWEPITNRPSPSEDWSAGGPIIERERIHLTPTDAGGTFDGVKQDRDGWLARCTGDWKNERGDTPLIAAMRAYVAHELGDEVEI